MYGKKNFPVLIVCGILIAAFLVTGCGKKKDVLDLPEEEMRHLKAVERDAGEAPQDVSAQKKAVSIRGGKKFYVYADRAYFKNHYIPSGWMGDYGDIKFTDGWKENPHSRRTCIKIIYTAEKKQGAGWAGIYWQDPANNWGGVAGGYDLTGAEKLTFYARGENGGEIIAEFKMGGIQGEFSDSTSVSIGPVVLTTEWEKYTIDLRDEDLSCIIGGFCFAISGMENPEGITFYLDEIAYD